MSWYTLQTRPNYEAKVTQAIEKKIAEGLKIREIFAPIETVFELKDGKKVEKKKRVYTNYIFVELDYNDLIWHSLKEIKGVVGFIGPKGKPAVLSEKEVEHMKLKVQTEAPKPKIMFDKGASVRINSGSFENSIGVIKDVDYSKSKAKVEINIFNRSIEVDLDLNVLEISTD